MIFRLLGFVGVGVGFMLITRNALAQYENGDNYVIPKSEFIKTSNDVPVMIQPTEKPSLFSLDFISGFEFTKIFENSYDKPVTKYDGLIKRLEKQYDFPPDLLHRLLYQESRFRNDIISGQKVSRAGAIGIAQLLPQYHPRDGIKRGYWRGGQFDLTDAEKSIQYAAAFLNFLYTRYGDGDYGRAVIAYNAGEGTLRKNGNNLTLYTREAQNYVADITGEIGYSTALV